MGEKRGEVMWSYSELRMEIVRARITALFLNEYGVANRLDDMLEKSGW